MTYFGVPILDWVLLVLLIGLGIEAYVTTRRSSSDESDADLHKPAKDESQEAKVER